MLQEPRNLIHLPGKTLEGGGQLVRLALCLSSITRIPVRITDIRGNRPGGGGLKPQHLTAATWLAAACDAQVEGLVKGSRELTFIPSEESGGARWFDKEYYRGDELVRRVIISQSSPGSIGLVLQAVLPFLLFSGGSSEPASTILLDITGGTNVSHSPSYEYISQVLLPALENIGLPPISSTLHARGWSTGGQKMGKVSFSMRPLPEGTPLPSFSLTNKHSETKDRGPPRSSSTIEKIDISFIAPNEARPLIRQEAVEALAKAFPSVPTGVIVDEDSHHPKRLYLLLVAHLRPTPDSSYPHSHRLGRDWLYDRKITQLPTAVHDLVHTVTHHLTDQMRAATGDGGCVDEFLQDQLVVFQALAQAPSLVDAGPNQQSSLHTRTARWVASRMLDLTFDERTGGLQRGWNMATDRNEEESRHDDDDDGDVVYGENEEVITRGIATLDVNK